MSANFIVFWTNQDKINNKEQCLSFYKITIQSDKNSVYFCSMFGFSPYEAWEKILYVGISFGLSFIVNYMSHDILNF